MSYRYILGDSKRETERLREQAKLWDPVAYAFFDRLGIRRGARVLEVGPGQGSLHRELRRRIGGPVDAVERSEVFARALQAGCKRERLGSGRFWVCDLREADLPEEHYDLIFARWVFLFLPDPEAHLRQLVRALKPGGRIAIEDYHRETLALIPRSPDWESFMAADRAYFAQHGGDVSIGGRLPELFARAGLTRIQVTPTLQSGRPGSLVWRWLSRYFLEKMTDYGKLAPFTPARARKLKARWLAAEKNPAAVLIAPTLLDVVGTKSRRTASRA